MKLSTRIILLCAITLFGISVISAISLYSLRQTMKKERTEQISNMVEMAHAAIEKAHALEQSGKLSREEAEKQAKLAISSFHKEDMYFFVRGYTDDLLRVHPKTSRIGVPQKDMKESGDRYRAALAKGKIGIVEAPGTRPGVEGQVDKIYAVMQFAPWDWLIGTGTYLDDINDAFWRQAGIMLGVGAIMMTMVGALAWHMTRSILRQLGGEPAYAAEVVGHIAEGDLTADIQVKDHDQSSLLFAIKTMRDKLASVVSEVRTGSESIATASGEIASGNLDLSNRTEQQAGALEETSSTMEELTSTVKQNADNARQANQLAISASEVATQGGNVVGKVVATMGSINESSKKIVDIISVIDGIAFQTNILALNAAVEAARAGEQGRGFAVVASEVRNLAQRSASAAKEIKTLIDSSAEKVEEGGKLVAIAGSTMDEVVASVRRVTDIVAEIASASQEQSSGIEQVNHAIVDMDNMTQQNAALVEQASAAAQAMNEQAASLAQVVNIFKVHTAAAPLISPARAQARTNSAQATQPRRLR
ncbi:methyl-accepting chemotaxis protein [Undibacterium sp.]|uniref:methyl-accepting chemotaxis protein n=1 Tax=Undibacterium sp. TaxID=1914977 RepID=UPI00272F0BAC|nr:methyl-accepting chemotaxis protein [Undibacterium sp.]MDP1979640.1 methyl-accepting chemotaxis protein [Undibacterium sp.]